MNIDGYYQLDPDHSAISFTARHAMISRVQGTFEDWNATILINEGAPEKSHIIAHVDAASLSTRQPRRDAHLRSADFLDVRTYPDMSFVSTDIQFQGSDTVYATGDLTIMAVTRPVTFNVRVSGTEQDHLGNIRVGFHATTVINRVDFGVVWNAVLDSGSVLISEEIEINIDGSAVREEAAENL
ncbi:YceI family protein [Corynebacterium cystitidis]|uniref:YceI family protein n=1 Tax=Corynebacterium cystitidis TaxID=35757 RepID=UPI00211E7B39|nr:YceI family protein [Corynebacterium cystitidis]